MRRLFAPILIIGGVVLAVLGLVLWRELPIAASGPPFVFAPLLAIGLGLFDLWWHGGGARRP